MKYTTSIVIHGQEIIPSDVFDSHKGQYVLMDIIPNEEGVNMLHIMGLSGPYTADMFIVEQDVFTAFSLHNLEESILKYKQY